MIDNSLCTLSGTHCVNHQWWETIIFPGIKCGFTLFGSKFYIDGKTDIICLFLLLFFRSRK